MKNKVYGIIGIGAYNSNFNADFTGDPKTLSTGEIYASDKALKYCYRNSWLNDNEKVLFTKTYKINKDKIQPKTLEEQFKDLFGKKDYNQKGILEKLFNAIDVKNFGATYPVSNESLSINGVVQFTQGINIYKNTYIENETILSPFQNSKKSGETTQSSLGERIFTDECHYCYAFSIFPEKYDIYLDVVNDSKNVKYTNEDYEKFKKTSLSCVSEYNSVSKAGCENEYAIFIKLKEGHSLPVSNLNKYVSIGRKENKLYLNLNNLVELLNKNIHKIENVEIYYNKLLIELVDLEIIEKNSKFIIKDLLEG